MLPLAPHSSLFLYRSSQIQIFTQLCFLRRIIRMNFFTFASPPLISLFLRPRRCFMFLFSFSFYLTVYSRDAPNKMLNCPLTLPLSTRVTFNNWHRSREKLYPVNPKYKFIKDTGCYFFALKKISLPRMNETFCHFNFQYGPKS